MALFTITTVEQPPGPPDQVGDLTINLDYGVNHTFTVANFTTETNPVYSHEDGYAADKIRIEFLNITSPATLELNSVAVNVGDEINVSDIPQLVYTQQSTHDGYDDTLSFTIADDTSGLFVEGFGTITIRNAAQANLPPSSVDDGSVSGAVGETIVLTRDLFTFTDPEGDPASKLKVLTLPTGGTLQLSGVDVVLNQEINFTSIDAGNFSYINSDTTGTYTFDFAVSDSGSGQFTS